MIRRSGRAVAKLAVWAVVTVALATFGTGMVRETPPHLEWTPLHVLPFATLVVGAYRGGRHFVQNRLLVAYAVMCAIGFLDLLLPDARDRYALQMDMVSIWFYVARTGVFFAALPIICIYVGTLGRRRALRDAGHCTCGYDLTGNVSGRCPECGSPITHSVSRKRHDS